MLLYALALLWCLACLFRGAGCAFDSVLLICICILCNPLMLRIFSDTFTLHLQYLQYITVQSFTSENILVLCHNFVNEPRNQNILKGLQIKTSGCCSEATTLRLHELVDLSQSSIWIDMAHGSNQIHGGNTCAVCSSNVKGSPRKLMPFVVLGQLLLALLSVQNCKLRLLKMLKSFSLREVLLLICCSHLAERKIKHVN